MSWIISSDKVYCEDCGYEIPITEDLKIRDLETTECPICKNVDTRVTKCYLVEVIDKDGNTLDSENYFGTESEAKKRAEKLFFKWASEQNKRNYER